MMEGIVDDNIMTKTNQETLPNGDYNVHVLKINTPDQANYNTEINKTYKKGKNAGRKFDLILVTLEVHPESHSDFARRWLTLKLFVTTDCKDYDEFKTINKPWMYFLVNSGYMDSTDNPVMYPTCYNEIKDNLEKFVGLPLCVKVEENPHWTDSTKLVNKVDFVNPWHDAAQYIPKENKQAMNQNAETFKEEDDDLPF